MSDNTARTTLATRVASEMARGADAPPLEQMSPENRAWYLEQAAAVIRIVEWAARSRLHDLGSFAAFADDEFDDGIDQSDGHGN